MITLHGKSLIKELQNCLQTKKDASLYAMKTDLVIEKNCF